MGIALRFSIKGCAYLVEAFAIQPLLAHALVHGKTVGCQLAAADGQMPALVLEHEDAHGLWLTIQYVGIEKQRPVVRGTLARQIIVNKDRCVVALNLAAAEGNAAAHQFLGLGRSVQGIKAGTEKCAGGHGCKKATQ